MPDEVTQPNPSQDTCDPRPPSGATSVTGANGVAAGNGVTGATGVNAKEEMNLVDFPFATLNHKDGRDSIECVTWHTDPTRGRYRQKWLVSGNSRLGLPHEIADQIVIALILVWSEQGGPRTFAPTLYRLLKVLNLPHTKHYYDLLKKTLLQLDGLRFRSERAFWDNNRRQYVSLESFGLFDSLRLAFCVDGDFISEEEAGNYVEWSTPLWKSLQAGYLKTIDLSFYLQLERPLTRRLYRFLDKQLRYRWRFEIDVFSLASRLGMQSYDYPSKVKEKLQPAVDELVARGFLEGATYVKAGKFLRAYFVKAGAPLLALDAGGAEAAAEGQDAFGLGDAPGAGVGEEAVEDPTQDPTHDATQDPTAHAYAALWEQVLSGLKPHLAPAMFFSFVEPTLLLSIVEGCAAVGARNPMACSWLQARMVRRLKAELNYHLRAAGQPEVTALTVEPLGLERQ